jgi:hypothetical protein
MGCAALVQVGPVRQSFWAVLTRADGRLRERTQIFPRGGRVELPEGSLDVSVAGDQNGGHARARVRARVSPSRVPARMLIPSRVPARMLIPSRAPARMLIRDRGVVLDLMLEEEAGIEARCRHGRGEVWTRKQAGVSARGTLSLDGGPAREIEALAVIDDTVGHHARETEWWWSAGVGEGEHGAALAWNLVSGVNDPPSGSERAVWIDGLPQEVAPVDFAADLSRIRCGDGSELIFTAEAERSRSENLLIVRSEYRQPFGVFSGALPGQLPLARGLGVVEHHRARW